MAASSVLALDTGKTGCRAGLWSDGSQVGYGEAPGAVGLSDPGGVEQALARMGEAVDALDTRPPGAVGTVVAGLAGLLSAPGTSARLRAGLRARFPAASVVLTSDAVTSHAGALSGAPGVVLAVGTGASVLAVSAAGRVALVDGYGYLLGDAGSGYAIGRAGLDLALRQADGRGGSVALLDRLRERFGSPRDLPRQVHGAPNPARVVASFARDVVRAATDGDSAAIQICDRAARELAESVAAAARRAGIEAPVAVASTGGLLSAGDVLTAPLDRYLEAALPGTTRREADGDALRGGFLIATTPELPHRASTLCDPDLRGDDR
ncbi:N-acetylglucosamine kinase [Nocardioides sp. GCM10027113]|uniref:N-acetylglucosamine kinase n=1 Tax=unclassified Nocardioides TaxID=2615069 RepID=UPI00361BF81C